MLNRSKAWAVGLLLAAFAAGAAIGGVAQAALADRDDPPDRERRPRLSYAERLQRDLALTAEQRAAVDTIMARRQRDMREIWRAADKQVDAMRMTVRSEIMQVLDERQRETYEQINARHDSLHAERERGRPRR
jgi:Spy/CpxP family protein refolding chaperone